MANIIPPKTPFDALDPFSKTERTDQQATAVLSAFNLCACIAGEHLRSFGFRGFHQLATIGIASVALNSLESKTLISREAISGLFLREREHWKDDLQSEQAWVAAQGLAAILTNDNQGVSIGDAIKYPGFIQVMGVVSIYLSAAGILAGLPPGTPPPAVASAVGMAFRQTEFSPHVRLHASALVRAFLDSRQRGIERISLRRAWLITRKPYAIPAHEVRVGAAATPKEVKARRMNAGVAASGHAFIAMAERIQSSLNLVLAPNSPLFRPARAFGLSPLIKGDASQVYCSTFMRREGYEAFMQAGVYRDLWSLGPSWHYRYHDRPMLARSYAEMRAFGERGDGISYGYITTCDAWQNEVVESATRGYGEVEIYWKPERVLPFATATLEDSMHSAFMVDAENAASLAMLAVVCAAQAEWANDPGLAQLGAIFAQRGVPSGRFIEFQCHGPLTPDDVESVVIHQGKAPSA